MIKFSLPIDQSAYDGSMYGVISIKSFIFFILIQPCEIRRML